MDVVTEEDLEAASVLARYKVKYIVDPHIRTSAAHALQLWLLNGGGTLVSTVNGALLDLLSPTPAPSNASSVLVSAFGAGFRPTSFRRAGVVNFIKRDLQFVPRLDNATVGWSSFPAAWRVVVDPEAIATDTPMVVLGEQSHMSWKPSMQVVATYSDGAAAAVLRSYPSGGAAFYLGWYPGLSYFHPAIPLRPADKGNTDANFNHFVPTAFHAGARELLAMPALASTPDVVPVVVSEPLVESGVIQAPGLGTAIVLVNWSPHTLLHGLTVTLAFDVPWLRSRSATLASGRSVVVSRVPHPHAGRNASLAGTEVYRCTLDMWVTETIIRRETEVRGVA